MIDKINEILSGVTVPALLLSAGIFYGIVLGFFHIIKPRSVIRGLKADGKTSGISSGKAVTLALAGTLGVGNIVGVASAIYLGGFGAVFWMWISALVAMVLKYAEIVLAMRYRKYDENGRPYGAAMLYIKAFFEKKGFAKTGKVVGGVFAVFFLLNALSMGSMLQSNAIAEAAEGVFDVSPVFMGIALCVLTFIILKKGSGAMVALTEYLVPIMSFGYIAMSVAVMLMDISIFII